MLLTLSLLVGGRKFFFFPPSLKVIYRPLATRSFRLKFTCSNIHPLETVISSGRSVSCAALSLSLPWNNWVVFPVAALSWYCSSVCARKDSLPDLSVGLSCQTQPHTMPSLGTSTFSAASSGPFCCSPLTLTSSTFPPSGNPTSPAAANLAFSFLLS